jgi:hypothetical protein
MQKVMKNIPDDRLRVYIVWLPVLMTDDQISAERRASEFSDRRLTYFWDAHHLTGDNWKRTLRLDDIAWDVYLIYGPKINWRKQPPPPDFWMHQLGKEGSERGAPVLNENEFESKVRTTLRTSAVKPSSAEPGHPHRLRVATLLDWGQGDSLREVHRGRCG